MEPGVPEKRPVRVTIFNQSYTLLASGDAGDTEELARQVDELMTRIAAHGGNIDSTRVAVLTSLHLADQLRGIERELNDLKKRVEEKSKHAGVELDVPDLGDGDQVVLHPARRLERHLERRPLGVVDHYLELALVVVRPVKVGGSTQVRPTGCGHLSASANIS